jgi:Peptidase_C39 like family
LKIDISILNQPDDTTCGPTSLHAIYNHYGLKLDLQKLITDVQYLKNGGTLAVYLGIDALKRNFKATIFSFNLHLFDPTWFGLEKSEIIKKLEAQMKAKKGIKLRAASKAYIDFLNLGGQVMCKELRPDYLKECFDRNIPILTGLSATYLYRSKREFTNSKDQSIYDDIAGTPMGHFVVLCGMENGKILVADPFKENPISHDNFYRVSPSRLISAILLGVITYDGNLLIIEKK